MYVEKEEVDRVTHTLMLNDSHFCDTFIICTYVVVSVAVWVGALAIYPLVLLLTQLAAEQSQ